MQVLTEADREFWRGVLGAGGFTALPRWSRDPIAGVAVHDAEIPEDLMAALRRLADELGVPLSSVLLAAHAKVLSALSGERQVATGYIGGTGRRTVAVPADDRGRVVARATARHPSRRGAAAVARGLSVGRAQTRAERDGTGVRDRLRPDRRRTATSARAPCCGWESRSEATSWCCDCGTGRMCWMRTALRGSPAIT